MKRFFIIAAILLNVGCCTFAQNLKFELITSKKELKFGKCSLEINYPTTGNAVFDRQMDENIRKWITESNESLLSDKTKSIPTGNAKQMKRYMKAYCKEIAQSLHEEWKSFVEEDDNEDLFYKNLQLEQYIRIDLLYEGEKFFCLSRYYYDYGGGVHGMHGLCPVIIRKSDGKVIKEVFREDRIDELTEYLYSNLKKDDLGGLMMEEYDLDDVDGRKDFAEVFRNYDTFGAPSYAWVDAENLNIQYNSYEIVPYAYGSPVISLPLSFARKYLTDEVLELLK